MFGEMLTYFISIENRFILHHVEERADRLIIRYEEFRCEEGHY
jgi:hypothetical protein